MASFFNTLWHQQLGRPYKLHTQFHSQTGPTVIFLHGIAASSDKWNHLIPLVQDSYRCITIDLLGFGKSPKPQWPNYTMEDHLRSLHKTIKGLGLHEDYILVGHSLGGLLATRYSLEYPRHINRLLLLSPPIYPPLLEIKGRLARGRTALFLRIYKFLRSHPRMTPANFKRLSVIMPLPKSIITQPATWTPFMRTLEHCIKQQTTQQDIKRLTIPIDLFYGSLDQVVIGSNLEIVAAQSNVQLHRVRGTNHDIGSRYAANVARFMVPSKVIKKTRTKSSGL